MPVVPQENPDRTAPTVPGGEVRRQTLVDINSSPMQTVATSSSPVQYSTDKVEIQRLKGSNWATWKWQLQNVLDAKGLTDVLTGNEPRGTVREVAARQIISSSLDQTLICKVIHCQSAQQIWTCLRGIYENRTSFALTDLIGKMNSFRMNTLDDVENGVSEIQSIACQIQALGGTVDSSTIESAILRALPKSFSSFLTSWTFLDTEKRTLENLHAHLMRTVCLLRSSEPAVPKEKALTGKHFKGKGKGRSKDSSGDSSKKNDLICNYCKRPGHMVKDCRKLANKKAAEEKAAGTSDKSDRPPKSDKSDQDDKQRPSRSDQDTPNARIAYGSVATVGNIARCHKQTYEPQYVESSWIADSGASFHMTPHLEWISDYQEFRTKIPVRLGDSHIVKAYGKGFIETTYGTLEPVFYLPEITENLFSVASCAKVHKIFALSTDKSIIFMKDDEELFRGHLNDCGVYEIKLTVKLATYVNMLSTSLSDWHKRLAHVSPDVIKYMADHEIVDGIRISDKPQPKCEPCAAGKSHRSTHSSSSTPRAPLPGQVLHFDTIGPMPETSVGGSKYWVLCKDSYSSYRQIFFTQTKEDISTGVKQIISRSKLQTGNDALKVITDNGSEYCKHDLKAFFDVKGIVHHTSAAYTPEQNGVIERDIRTVAESARSLRLQAGLPRIFWAEAMATAVYTLNRVINTRNKVKTPYELWFNKKPSLNNIHRFGEQAIVYVEPQYRDKIDPKGEKLTFVGYTDVFNTFKFVDLKTNRFVISSNANFLNQDYDHEGRQQPTYPDAPDTVVIDIPNLYSDEPDQDESDDAQDANQTYTIDQDPIIEPDINNSDLTEISSIQEEVVERLDDSRETPAKMPPENPDPERIQTLRPRNKQPLYTGWKVNLSTIEASDDPNSFSEAMSRTDKDLWLAAMREELDSLDKCQVWSLVNKPHNRNIVSNRWVLKIKRKPDGSIDRYRARLVARGFSQKRGVDYNETYAPTSSAPIIRLLFAYAAVEGLYMSQFDVKTAFLYGDLNEQVFMMHVE